MGRLGEAGRAGGKATGEDRVFSGANGDRQPGAVTRLLLLRHGETEGNRLGQLLGATDLPLNDRGREQARRLGRWLARHERVDAVSSSHLSRAYETAAIICRELERTEPHLVDENLAEMNFGEAEGTPVAHLATTFPHLADYVGTAKPEHPDWRWPGGDSNVAYYQRVIATVERFAQRHTGQTVALVTHGGVIAGYLHWATRQVLGFAADLVVENCSITELRFDEQGVTVVRLGERPWMDAHPE